MIVIIPSCLTSAFAADTKASDLGLDAVSKAFEQSLTARGKHSPSRTWLRRWKTDSWMQLLFSRTFQLSHGSSSLRSWLEGFCPLDGHASPFQQQENEKQRRTSGGSSTSLQMELPFFDLECFLQKTSRDSCQQRCQMDQASLVTASKDWSGYITGLRQAYSARLNAVRRTSGSECSSWPTSSARDWKDSAGMATESVNPDGSKRMRVDQLARAVFMHGPPAPASSSTDGSRQESSVATRDGNWTTPAATDTGRTTQYQQGGKALSMQAAAVQWATPIMGDSHLASTQEAAQKRLEEGKVTLSRQMAAWATPRAEHDSGAHRGQPDTLHSQIKQWPTPSADGDSRPGANADPVKWQQIADTKKAQGIHKQLFLTTKVAMQQTGKLNPRWVETLMGLPVGWTMPSCVSPVTIGLMSCDSSETELSQQQPSGPSEC